MQSTQRQLEVEGDDIKKFFRTVREKTPKLIGKKFLVNLGRTKEVGQVVGLVVAPHDHTVFLNAGLKVSKDAAKY